MRLLSVAAFASAAACSPADQCEADPCDDGFPGPDGACDSSPFTDKSTLFVILPDTQAYASHYPGVFVSQTSWISRNVKPLNIAYVFHLGDFVENNTDVEWRRARESMALLDGQVPYALAIGNHDYSPCGDASLRETPLNDWFRFSDTAALPSFGGAFEPEKLDNTYHLFEAGGHSWIAVVLEWGPRDETIAWANEVMEKHPDRLGVLVTHAYLNNHDHRYDHTAPQPQRHNPHHDDIQDVNDGEELWQKLVRRHRFVLTLNGHALGDGTGHLASKTDRGNVVHQILTNFQTRSLGGDGYLTLIELLPDGSTIRVHSYSPFLDRFILDSDHRFTFQLDAS